jgi:hypothetical protein
MSRVKGVCKDGRLHLEAISSRREFENLLVFFQECGLDIMMDGNYFYYEGMKYIIPVKFKGDNPYSSLRDSGIVREYNNMRKR